MKPSPFPLGLSIARHALAWLVLANAVGVLLALLLLHPGLATLLGPLGYGRWMPVHMDGQLYGWCALPLVGLLLRMYWINGYVDESPRLGGLGGEEGLGDKRAVSSSMAPVGAAGQHAPDRDRHNSGISSSAEPVEAQGSKSGSGGLQGFSTSSSSDVREAQARWALRAWSLALACGCVAWLGGTVSGKLFMDWHGWARPAMPLAMLALWVVLAGWEEGRRAEVRAKQPVISAELGSTVPEDTLMQGAAGNVVISAGTLIRQEKQACADMEADVRAPCMRVEEFARTGRIALLAILFCVPWIFWLATSRAVFPTVNPGSGGATGTALLGSTLGIVLIHGLAPRVLGLARRVGHLYLDFGYWGWAAASLLLFAAADHGDAPHSAPGQILSLATLLVWAPLSWGYLRSFEWPSAARPWLGAALVWWALLLASGWASFLPGISERLKFTHALVGHAHLALAGFVSSLGWALLISLGARAPGRITFWLWQAACAVHVSVLLILGVAERAAPADLFLGAVWVQALLSVRLVTGLLMLAVSIAWLLAQLRKKRCGA